MFEKCLIVWISYFVACSNAGTVSWLKPCAPLDSPCLLKSAQFALPSFTNGIKEHGIPAIEPMPIKDTNADTGDLKLSFKNVTINNLSKCVFKSFTRDPVKLKASVTTHCPTIIKGQYKMSGMLIVNVFGEGDFTIGGGIMSTTTDLQLKAFTKNGKNHYKVSSFDYLFEPLSKFELKFNNLYNGDKEKAAPVEKIMSEGWKGFILDMGKPLMKEGMISIVNVIDKVFRAFSTEELEIVE
ncbi:hypothetical protein PYW07_003372 [Mythimna separata]|uniref:Uncharacterized protein n=1 Tax=Mythimna separata TaxID=271217 RepID=A0AAD7YJ62_MYTSE|nr:hypothetical protein PYW07_003372 [Mythimna separata]